MARRITVLVACLVLLPVAAAHLPYGPRDDCVREHRSGRWDGPHNYDMSSTQDAPGYQSAHAPSLGEVTTEDGNTRKTCGADPATNWQYTEYAFNPLLQHPGNFDGDREWGHGGGIFPATGGLHPECWPGNSMGLPITQHHGSSYTIGDAALAGVADVLFIIGANDVHPASTISPNPDPFAPVGSVLCVVDNVISPSTDCGDYLTPTLVNSGTAQMPDPATVAWPPGNAIVNAVTSAAVSCPGGIYAPAVFPPGATGEYVIWILTSGRDALSPSGQMGTATVGHICDGLKGATACLAE